MNKLVLSLLFLMALTACIKRVPHDHHGSWKYLYQGKECWGNSEPMNYCGFRLECADGKSYACATNVEVVR